MVNISINLRISLQDKCGMPQVTEHQQDKRALLTGSHSHEFPPPLIMALMDPLQPSPSVHDIHYLLYLCLILFCYGGVASDIWTEL